MNQYNPQIHHRRSIRLKGYDYSQAGLYFITICCQDRACLFGSVVRGFKIGVTKWMRQNTTVYNVWQRNYYENIIRDEQSYQNISKYIINNPTKWFDDKFYSK